MSAAANKKRSKRRRADSRAHTECPHCGFRCHGARGVKMHVAQMHPEAVPAVRS